ncbi:MAG: hypothetical protein HQK53_11220 [Oligoflexia bacterium]|nr:hypothetical protein [Oligoflexia bacterium]
MTRLNRLTMPLLVTFLIQIQSIFIPAHAVSANILNDTDHNLPTLSEWGKVFEALFSGISTPTLEEIRDLLERYEGNRIGSGQNPQGTIFWDYQVDYIPGARENFVMDAHLNIKDYVADAGNLSVSGQITLKLKWFWNPLISGLCWVGMPLVRDLHLVGQIKTNGVIEKDLNINIVINRFTREISGTVNGQDIGKILPSFFSR